MYTCACVCITKLRKGVVINTKMWDSSYLWQGGAGLGGTGKKQVDRGQLLVAFYFLTGHGVFCYSLCYIVMNKQNKRCPCLSP